MKLYRRITLKIIQYLTLALSWILQNVLSILKVHSWFNAQNSPVQLKEHASIGRIQIKSEIFMLTTR